MPGGDADEDRVRRERIRWHCRRGLLELDLILGRFLAQHLSGMGEAQLGAFEALLGHTDNDLWDLVSGRGEVLADDQRCLLNLIRKA